MMRKVFALAMIIAVASAAVIPPPPAVCPTNNGKLLLSSAGITSANGFIPNTFTYQGGGQPIMSGQPQGPWFSVIEGPDSYFIPNSTLAAKLNVYGDSSRTQLIGTGTMASNNMFVSRQGGVDYFGGDIQVSITIPSSPFPGNDPTRINFRSGSFSIHFRAQREFPQDTNLPSIANVLKYSSMLQNQEAGSMTMWGADGFDGAQFSNAVRGMDIMFNFQCPNIPPIVIECPDCSNPASNFVVPSACIALNQRVHHHSNDKCITMSWTSSPSTSTGNGCSSLDD